MAGALVVFTVVFLLNVIPAFAPPTWMALGHWVSQYWYRFTAFVGLNLFQSAFTNWCPMMTFSRKLRVPEGVKAITAR